MAVSFGQDSTWLKVTGGTKAVDMAQVLYVEYTEERATSSVAQAPVAVRLYFPGNASIFLTGEDIGRVRAWIADEG